MQPNFLNQSSQTTPVRVAIYARYSSDLQRPTSIEDQIRNCRAIAGRNGWIVVEEYIRSDAEITGQSLDGRDGLNELIELAKTTPKPFDGILIDDTSRFGRYLPDVVRLADILEGYGVFLHFGTQGLDSRSPGFRQVFIISAMMDEQSVASMRDKVHRGQHGRVLNGCVPGGKCYGYQNIPIEDPTRKGEWGRPAVIGVNQRPIPAEAAIVRRIFEMYAAGSSYADVAKALNKEGVLSPQPPRKGRVRAWCPSAIREMLLNEKYRGVQVWNRTKTVRNRDKNGRIEQRPRDESEWVRVEVPELRIVSDELWQAAREQNRIVREKHDPKRLGGMNRTEASRRYIFSGLLECGVCGRNMTTVSGKAPNARYGCPNHRFRGVCSNDVTIPQRRLEEQLLTALSRNLLDHTEQESLVRAVTDQVRANLEAQASRARHATERQADLKQERAKLAKKATNLAAAIADYSMSATLKMELQAVEARLNDVDKMLAPAPAAAVPSFSDDEVREFVKQTCQNLVDVLSGDPVTARRELQKRITKLVLTPRRLVGRRTLAVTGDVSLFSRPDVMVTNSTGGIDQHYNHATMITAVERIGNLIPPMQLSRMELQPQMLIVRFPPKAIKGLLLLPVLSPSECLGLIPERL
ncbi:MAG TPA: recombinase family protein [Terriglobales bacterium]|nr:recombinase family protein [Terriglobales bacterium]